MVRAYHLILTSYGFWLPNDPRGSWSDTVRSFDLYLAGGRATRVHTRRSVAHVAHDHEARRQAKAALEREPVEFDGRQARAVIRGFKDYATRTHLDVYACATMPDHAHLVIGRCAKRIESIAEQLKARATLFLNREDLHPFAGQIMSNGRPPTPWSRKCWSVFLDTDASIRRAIHYVEQNPVKAGYKPQRYTWVKPFDNG